MAGLRTLTVSWETPSSAGGIDGRKRLEARELRSPHTFPAPQERITAHGRSIAVMAGPARVVRRSQAGETDSRTLGSVERVAGVVGPMAFGEAFRWQ